MRLALKNPGKHIYLNKQEYMEKNPTKLLRSNFKCLTPASITSSGPLLHNFIAIDRFAHNMADSPSADGTDVTFNALFLMNPLGPYVYIAIGAL